jgi:hypothetical protein
LGDEEVCRILHQTIKKELNILYHIINLTWVTNFPTT